jgi:hypothetical protein
MLVTDLGISTETSPLYQNAKFPIFVTPDGITAEVRFLVHPNALSLISVRVPEITTDLISLDSKALRPKLITELGITTEVRVLFENALLPILVTEFGIVTDVIFAHWNAVSPILFMDGSITKLPVQPLDLVILLAGISTE